jgi:hypothetical protein
MVEFMVKYYKRGWHHTKKRGKESTVVCGFCGRVVPKYKTFSVVRGFRVNDRQGPFPSAEQNSCLPRVRKAQEHSQEKKVTTGVNQPQIQFFMAGFAVHKPIVI